jgi:hypothetical protein
VPDTSIVVAIAIIAYAVSSVLHEGAGHGGACVLTGGKPLVMSTVHFDCAKDSRIISASLLAASARDFRGPRVGDTSSGS